MNKTSTEAPRPGHTLGPGDAALAVALVAVAALLGAADLAGALVAHARPVGLGAAARVLVELVRGLPARWPAGGRPVARLAFFVVLGALFVPPVLIAAALGVSTARHRHAGASGFAALGELRATAGLGAVRREARTTRPSLADKKSSELSASDVGYPLGRSVAPRSVLGRPVPLVSSFEHSLLVVAPPGAGKTLRVLAPVLRDHPGPALATSTKPDLVEVCVGKRRGPVVALDPERLCPGIEPLRWSPVAGCTDPVVAQRRASALVAATGEGADVRSGAFFRRSAVAVLAAYLHAAALSGGSMRDVVRWATRPSDPAPLRILADTGDGSIDWAARLHAHTSGAEETTSGVVRTIDLALACFADPHVLAHASGDEAFDAASFLEEYGTVFALGKDRGALGGTGPLVTAFCDEFLRAAEDLAATKPARRLDPPLLCCLDEAPSIAPLPGLPALVADGRGRGIVVLVAMQSFSQAEGRWGRDGAETIRNAASVLVVFGGLGVARDLDELSRLAGTRRTERWSQSEDVGGRRSSSVSLVEEPVLSPAAIRSLPAGTALVLIGRLPPVLARFPSVFQGRGADAVRAEERAARDQNDRARAGPRHEQARASETETGDATSDNSENREDP